MEKDYKYMVCTRCMTYNHAPYIKETLNGFAMQVTTFPVVYCIIDDASTDGEAGILCNWAEERLALEDAEARLTRLDYGELIVAPLKERKNLLFVILLLDENHYRKKTKLPYIAEWDDNAKYIAFCEGDDFWTNSSKLQIQYDYMEANPSCSLCHGDVVYYNDDTKLSKGRIGKLINHLVQRPSKNKSVLFNRIVKSQYGAISLTYFFRREHLDRIKKNTVKLMMGDTPLLLDLSQFGYFMYFPEIFGVYRIHTGSAVHKTPKENRRFLLGIQEMFVYYCNKYNYKVPFIVKYRYNTAYLSILINDGTINPTPLYDLFSLLYYKELLLKNRYTSYLLKRIVYPIQIKCDGVLSAMRFRFRHFLNRKIDDYYYNSQTGTIELIEKEH